MSSQRSGAIALPFVYTCSKEQLPPPGGGAQEAVHPGAADSRSNTTFPQLSSGAQVAQELRKLHASTYATATYANPEAEKVGQMVLANQFISGLRPELQPKLVGVEGDDGRPWCGRPASRKPRLESWQERRCRC